MCSVAQAINHDCTWRPYCSVLPCCLHYRGLIKQLCELESEIPLLQIIINYGESVGDVGLNYPKPRPGRPWFMAPAACLTLITPLHFWKLGTASQQTKNYVLLFAITNMLEGQGAIKCQRCFTGKWWWEQREKRGISSLKLGTSVLCEEYMCVRGREDDRHIEIYRDTHTFT